MRIRVHMRAAGRRFLCRQVHLSMETKDSINEVFRLQSFMAVLLGLKTLFRGDGRPLYFTWWQRRVDPSEWVYL